MAWPPPGLASKHTLSHSSHRGKHGWPSKVSWKQSHICLEFLLYPKWLFHPGPVIWSTGSSSCQTPEGGKDEKISKTKFLFLQKIWTNKYAFYHSSHKTIYFSFRLSKNVCSQSIWHTLLNVNSKTKNHPWSEKW